MTPTRRDFIKSAGIAIASLVMARCIPMGGGDDSPRSRLRSCWLRLDWLAQQTQEWDNYELGERAREELVTEHRAALDDLVAAGQLDPVVADQMHIAFSEAAYHVWRSNAPITCYEPSQLGMAYMRNRGELVQQIELLEEMARVSAVDEETVTLAHTAIEQDIAFLTVAVALETLDGEARWEAERQLVEQFEAGEIETSPEAVEAARILVDLLLRRME